MSGGSLVRRALWNGVEFVRGRPIQRHIADIAAASEEPDAVSARSLTRLKALIEHACTTTVHYREVAGAEGLRDFPVLQKREIRRDYESFVSSAYSRDSLVPATTSGSYGTPFTFLLTPEKKARQKAEVIYYGRWCGYDVGDRHVYTVWREGGKSRWRLFVQNEVLMNVSMLDRASLESGRQTLLRDSIEVIIAYPSAMGALAEYCLLQGDDPASFDPLRSIVTMGEPLQPVTRELIRRAFECRVRSRYSTQEFGVLAQECECANHHLNTASYIFEVLSPNGEAPMVPGELGRLVVTDLYSHAMPLFRYDTGDLAVAGEGCPCGRPGPVLRSLHGRLVEEIVGAEGQRISPFAINGAMRDLEGVLQFQFVQMDRRCYELRLCILPSFQSEAEVRRRLLATLGEAAELRVRYVPEIPPLPSGKRPYIVNEWRQARTPGAVRHGQRSHTRPG